jgi:hypothetical protein
MCYPNFSASKFVAISIFMIFSFISYSLEFVSLDKKDYAPMLLLLNRCKFFYFIMYNYLTFRVLPDREILVFRFTEFRP